MRLLQLGRTGGRKPAESTGSGTLKVLPRRGLRFWFCLIMAVILVVTIPAGAWSVPSVSGDCAKRFNDGSSWYETSKQCQFAAQLEPDRVFVGGEKELGTGYYIEPHVYHLENTIRLFREMGYDNWALYLSSPDRFQAMADGATWADAYKGRLVVHFSIHILWVEVYSYDYDVCNYAGFDQYYNTWDQDPAGRGLDSEGLNVLTGLLPVLVKTLGPAIVETVGAIVGVPGLGGLLAAISVDVRPGLQGEYPSGALQAQQHYDSAIGYYFNGATDPVTGNSQLYWPQRPTEYNSLFQLGWASHYIQDIGVIYHIHDIGSSFPPNPHNDFEDDAKGHGDPFDGISKDYHVSTWTLGLDYQNKKITELARDEATAINDENDWALARSDDAAVRESAVQKGVQVSEQYTAAVIAKYLTETGIPKVKQPFQGTVEDLQGKPVPYAYVFYRKGKECIWHPDIPIQCGMPPGAWNYMRADKNGVYVLDLKPSDASTIDMYLVRPVMPGYRYVGYQNGSSSELMGATTDGKPLEYQPPWKSEAVNANPYYEFYLTPLETGQPVQQMVVMSPVMLLFQPGDLTPATADTLTKNLIAVTPESPVLRVHTADSFQQMVISLPETSYVEVQLANLVDLNAPKVLQSPATIRSTVIAAKNTKAAWYAVHKPDPVSAVPPSGSAALQYPLTGSEQFVPASSKEGWHRVILSLPKTRVKAPNGTMVEAPDLSFAFGTAPVISGDFLPANGMARIPAANAQVEVTLDAAPGFIGPGFNDLYPGTAKVNLPGTLSPASGQGQAGLVQPLVTPAGCLDATGSSGCQSVSGVVQPGQKADPLKKSLIITTDSTGRAAVVFQTGNQAGRVRMHFRVISNPDAPGVLLEKSVEFTVHPLVNEPDGTSAVPPIIQAVEPREPFILETAGAVITPAGPKTATMICLNLTPDGNAVQVVCPEKPFAITMLDFISSVTARIQKIPGSFMPSPAIQPATTESPPCDDGNACTVRDRMVRGSCIGDRVICTDDAAGTAGRCDPAAGCVYGPAAVSRQTRPITLPSEDIPDLPAVTRHVTAVPEEVRTTGEEPCDDADFCTSGDLFKDGVCRGRPVICDDIDDATADRCDPASGCVFTWRERVTEVPVTSAEREPAASPEATRVVVQVTDAAVLDPCPAGCSCLTPAEAKVRFGRYLPCSDTPCGSLASRTGTVPRYCLRPAA
jgi:hypothetical protein